MRTCKRIRVPAVVAAVLFAVGLRVADAQTTTSPTLLPRNETSGMVGLAPGQTARLNALHPNLPAPLAAGALCSATVTFEDDQGSVLKSQSITVIPGKSVSVDLDRDTDLPNASGRVQIRAVLSFPALTPTASSGSTTVPVYPAYCSLTPTLEIFDNATLKTQVVMTDFQFQGVLAYRLGTFAGASTR